MRRQWIIMVMIGSMMLGMGACQQRENKGADTFCYTDDYGRRCDIPSSPKRIVSLSPAVTEIIYALGGQEMLVGRTDFCNYPSEVAQIESIGGISNMNVEKVLSLNPDLVIGGSMIPEKSIEQLEQMGVAVACVTEQQKFEGLYENITKIGRLTGKEAEAEKLNEALRKRVAECQPVEDGPSVYYVVGFGAGGNYTAGGNTFINDIISMAGGKNIAADMEGWSYSMEALMKADPDYILIRKEDSASFVNAKPYSTLKAVEEQHVVGLESGCIDLQVPRNIETIVKLRQLWSKL